MRLDYAARAKLPDPRDPRQRLVVLRMRWIKLEPASRVNPKVMIAVNDRGFVPAPFDRTTQQE